MTAARRGVLTSAFDRRWAAGTWRLAADLEIGKG